MASRDAIREEVRLIRARYNEKARSNFRTALDRYHVEMKTLQGRCTHPKKVKSESCCIDYVCEDCHAALS